MINNQKVDEMPVSLEGKQQMLTQKVSEEEFIISHGIGSKESKELVINLFYKTLKDLNSVDVELNSPVRQDTKILRQLSQKQASILSTIV